MTSAVAFAMALNSVFGEDLATVCYFFEDLDIKLWPKKTQNLLVECLSLGHPAQSVSEKAMIFKPEEAEIFKPTDDVCLRYLKMCLIACQCVIRRA